MPIDRQDLRRSLAAVAATQSGYFTAALSARLGRVPEAARVVERTRAREASRADWL